MPVIHIEWLDLNMEIAIFYTWKHSIITCFCGLLLKAMVYS
jgi:hypothetical protein